MENIKNQCQTILRYDENHKPIYKDKHKYDSLDDAIEVCKKLNSRDGQITKLVSYKCNVCFKYHIGRNGKTIKDKYRNKLKSKSPKVKFKVIGKIEL